MWTFFIIYGAVWFVVELSLACMRQPGRTHADSHCLVGRLIRAWLGASLVWLPVALPVYCINSLMHDPRRMLILAWPDRNGSDLRFCGA